MSDPARTQGATVADLLAIPEEHRRHEVIDGVLMEKEAASGRHGRAQVRLSRQLGPYDRRPGGRWPGGWWFATEVEVQFEEDEVFRPDIAGWRRERLVELPEEVPIQTRPDWVCEILSKNKRNDLIKKKRVYHRHAVGHYWIIDPVEETLAVYRWHTDGFVETLVADRSESVRAEPFDAIELRVGVPSAKTRTIDERPPTQAHPPATLRAARPSWRVPSAGSSLRSGRAGTMRRTLSSTGARSKRRLLLLRTARRRRRDEVTRASHSMWRSLSARSRSHAASPPRSVTS